MAPPPLAPAHAVDRSSLRRRLDEALVRPLTLIVAPAGAGKSVLLAQWAATHPDVSFVWMEVGVDDDDPVRFSQRLLSGLAAINSDFADLTALTSLHGGGLGAPLLEALEAQLAELTRSRDRARRSPSPFEFCPHLRSGAAGQSAPAQCSFGALDQDRSPHRLESPSGERPTDRDPPVRPGPRRRRLCRAARTHHRTVARNRPRGHAGRPEPKGGPPVCSWRV